jgi:hypothetical protein
VAWISGEDVVFGVTAYGFETCRLRLGADAGRFASRLLLREDGGVDAVLLSNDASAISIIHVDAPVWVDTRTSDGDTPEAEADEPEGSDVEDEEAEEPEPEPATPRVTLNAPVLLAKHALPLPATHAACARAAESPTGLLLAFDREGGIDLRYCVLDEKGTIRFAKNFRLDAAKLIPGAAPVMAIDEAGRALATLLHTSADEAALSRTRVAFAADASPLMIEGVGRERLCALPAAAEEAILISAGDPVKWQTGWCVLTADGRMMRSAPAGAVVVSDRPAGLLRPLVGVTDSGCAGVAVQAESGAIGFA